MGFFPHLAEKKFIVGQELPTFIVSTNISTLKGNVKTGRTGILRDIRAIFHR